MRFRSFVWRESAPNAMRLFLIALAVLCAGLTFAHLPIWQSESTLWASVLTLDPHNVVALTSAGNACAEHRDFPCALAFYARAAQEPASTLKSREIHQIAVNNYATVQAVLMFKHSKT